MIRKPLIVLFAFCCTLLSVAQNITVDNQTYSPQQLIEDILIDSNCISNIQVTNVVGGDFGGQEQSYGYFNANGSNFPLQEGIVLSTGRLQNVQGPNTSLSDDDAPDWLGDADLEFVLDEQNTTNATILEFTFQSTASEIRFRYVFASEEYQEGNPNPSITYTFYNEITNTTEYLTTESKSVNFYPQHNGVINISASVFDGTLSTSVDLGSTIYNGGQPCTTCGPIP